MNAQHTPGPWSSSCLPNGTEWTVSIENGDMLADLTGCPNETANARLIAAAPDLLAALQMVNRIWSHDQTANLAPDSPVAIVRAAIAKATGGAA